ncbi:uncharacterized protein ACMZJ9_004880 [Mantella aurantiaca]
MRTRILLMLIILSVFSEEQVSSFILPNVLSKLAVQVSSSILLNPYQNGPSNQAVQGTCSTTAKDLQESITLVQCPSDCTVNGKNVWGTGVYTEDSSICKAAIHDGVLSNEGGLVTVKKTAGQASYTGSTRYGVTTNNYGPWSGSFVFPDASKSPASNPTKDSSICKAAIHDGVLSNEGGLVTVKKTAGQASYTGSTRYGVTTNNYGPWSGSFVFPDASKPPASNPIKIPTQKPPVQGTCSTTAKDLQESITLKTNQCLLCPRVQCPSDCSDTGKNVWGTGVYTEDSSICKAAIHDGVLSNEGGLVTVKKTAGQASYSGSTRYGVTTKNYGPWSGSFVFPDASKPPASNPTKVPTQKPPVQGTCSTTAKVLQESITLVQCPSDCSDTGKNVWGTGVYTENSSICKAAIHDGVLSNEGGLVTVMKTAGQASYSGSTRYGVTTNKYGPWSGSFVFPDASKPPASNPTKVPTQKPPGKVTIN